MAFINKIFSIKKKSKSTENLGWTGFTFSEQQVRVVLFRDCDLQGRKLVFDSAAIQKISLDSLTKAGSKNYPLNGHLSALSPQSCCNSTHSLQETVRVRKLSSDQAPTITNTSIQFSSSYEDGVLKSKSTTAASHYVGNTKYKFTEISNGFGYQYVPPRGSEISALGEMVFGSVALTFRGTSSKVHTLNSTNGSTNMMCTHVFVPPIRPVRQSNVSRGSHTSSSTVSSISSDSPSQNFRPSDCNAGPLDVPRNANVDVDSGCSAGELSIGSYASNIGLVDAAPAIPANSTNSLRASSPNSSNRRLLRNFDRSLDAWPSICVTCNSYLNGGFCSSSSVSATATHSGSFNACYDTSTSSECCRPQNSSTDDSLTTSNHYSRKSKFGLAVIIELTRSQEKEMQTYLLEHMPLLDNMIWRLRDSIQKAYWRRQSFISVMLDGCNEAAQWIQHLLCPIFTFSSPLWLNETFSDSSANLSLSFDEINSLHGDSNERKTDLFWKMFFKTDNDNEKKNETEMAKFMRDFCELLTITDTKNTNFFLSSVLTGVLSHHLGWILSIKSQNANNPTAIYNSPLWTQLSEMHGAIGNPPRLAQTVVIGQNDTHSLHAILNVISYFTRYSQIERKTINLNKRECDVSGVSDPCTNINKKSVAVDDIEHSENLISTDTYQHTNVNSSLCSINNSNCDANLSNSGSHMNRTKSCLFNFDGESAASDVSVPSVDYHQLSKRVIEHFMSNDELSAETNVVDKFNSHVTQPQATETDDIITTDNGNVIFLLGDDQLIGIRPSPLAEDLQPQDRTISNGYLNSFCLEKAATAPIASSSNCSELHEQKCPPRSPCHQRLKKYSGVKFNFEQYPQIATNYMMSKNVEIANHPFLKKGLTMDDSISANFGELSKLSFSDASSECTCGFEDCSGPAIILQTPSNASELESTSDLPQKHEQFAVVNVHTGASEMSNNFSFSYQKLSNTLIVDPVPIHYKPIEFTIDMNKRETDDGVTVKNKPSGLKNKCAQEGNRNACSNTVSVRNNDRCYKNISKLHCTIQNKRPEVDVESNSSNTQAQIKLLLRRLSLPRCSPPVTSNTPPPGYKCSLVRSNQLGSKYLSGAVLQGVKEPFSEWGCYLRRDLALAVRHNPLNQTLAEAVCIVADMDNWTVHTISSSSITLSGLSGLPRTPVGPSQLITDMLDSVLQLWKLRTPPHHCLQHIENKLQEIYMRSFAFSELLLATDFCDIHFLTSVLGLHLDDVPLLFAIASTHTPQVTRKYGVTFQ